jgi:multiple sugar transport system permease protein
MAETFRQVLARVGFSVFVALAAAFFALPMLWLVFAPFDPTPTLAARPAGPTLANFRDVFQNPLVLTSLRNSLLLALYAMVLVVAAATLAAYALSRVRLPGRDLVLYVLLLFSSVVSGTAAMVPLFLLIFELGLINTYLA